VIVRADCVSDQPFYRATQTRFQWFNVSRFATPSLGTLGNCGRNILRGSGVDNWNLSLFRTTGVGERVTAQLRIEAFNVLNHT
jgi:hypothetical protein